MYKRGGFASLIAEKTCCVVSGRLKIRNSTGVLRQDGLAKVGLLV